MADVIEMLRQLIRHELAAHAPSHIGVVEAVKEYAEGDAENYRCDVRLQGRDLVLSAVPLAGDHLATVSPPAADDLVLVHFVGGNPDHPVVAGRLYREKLSPPPYHPGEIHTYLPPDAAESDRLELLMQGGKSGSRSWNLRLPADVAVTVTDKKVEATVGKLALTIDSESGQVVIKTSGAAVTVQENGAISVEANGNLTLDAKGNLEIKAGGMLKLNANGVVEVKGAAVNLN